MTWNTCAWDLLSWNGDACEEAEIEQCTFRGITMPPVPTGGLPPIIGFPPGFLPPPIFIPPGVTTWRPPNVKC
jgi:hypothetical protein